MVLGQPAGEDWWTSYDDDSTRPLRYFQATLSKEKATSCRCMFVPCHNDGEEIQGFNQEKVKQFDELERVVI